MMTKLGSPSPNNGCALVVQVGVLWNIVIERIMELGNGQQHLLSL